MCDFQWIITAVGILMDITGALFIATPDLAPRGWSGKAAELAYRIHPKAKRLRRCKWSLTELPYCVEVGQSIQNKETPDDYRNTPLHKWFHEFNRVDLTTAYLALCNQAVQETDGRLKPDVPYGYEKRRLNHVQSIRTQDGEIEIEVSRGEEIPSLDVVGGHEKINEWFEMAIRQTFMVRGLLFLVMGVVILSF